MHKITSYTLRVGLSATFILIGIFIIKAPEAWGGYLQPWAVDLLPVSVSQAMLGTAVLDILIGVALLINPIAFFAGVLATIHLAIVLITSGLTDITVRDIGLLAMAVVVSAESLPLSFKRFSSLHKKVQTEKEETNYELDF